MMTRKCDACQELITRDYFIELTMRVVKTAGAELQDATEEFVGDYCDTCLVTNGKAINDLLSDLNTYKLDPRGVIGVREPWENSGMSEEGRLVMKAASRIHPVAAPSVDEILESIIKINNHIINLLGSK